MILADTIVALSTPNGVGAIGIIRLSGPRAIEIVNEVFSKNILEAPGYSLHFGKIMDDAEILDEVLVSIFRGPHSYTKEDVAEISFHGSPYILTEALSLFIRKGARLAEAGEYTLRSFLNGGMDLAQAEAVADLIASQSKVAHDAALHQMRGGFSKELKFLREKLIEFASLVELELDFSEEDVEFADRTKLTELVGALRKEIKKLLNSFKLGNVIKSGVPTVIAGRPNAGKSTLLNALLNESRAIVSEIPGTTRDTIEEPLNINGIIFRLIDTAGLREATDTIEQQGILRTMEKIQQSAILIYVYDAALTKQDSVREDLSALEREDLKLIVIANKRDQVQLLPDNLAAGIESHIPGGHLYISSLTGPDTEWVKTTLFQAATGGKLVSDQTIVTSVRHFEALNRADEALEAAAAGIASGLSGEFLAIDIRRSLAALGEITGEITTEDLLGSIFSKFCIGK